MSSDSFLKNGSAERKIEWEIESSVLTDKVPEIFIFIFIHDSTVIGIELMESMSVIINSLSCCHSPTLVEESPSSAHRMENFNLQLINCDAEASVFRFSLFFRRCSERTSCDDDKRKLVTHAKIGHAAGQIVHEN